MSVHAYTLEGIQIATSLRAEMGHMIVYVATLSREDSSWISREQCRFGAERGDMIIEYTR